MAFDFGNKEWTRALMRGRKIKINSAQELYEKFQEYVNFCLDNPLKAEDWVGKDAMYVERQKMRPMLKSSFALFVGHCSWESLKDYGVRDSTKAEFAEVIQYIEKFMAEHNVTGAAAGLLHPNIISRVEGLVDKSQNDTTVNSPLVITLSDDRTDTQAK